MRPQFRRWSQVSRFAAAGLVCWCGGLAPAAADTTITSPDLGVEGTAFVLKLPDGRVRRGVQLQGAIVHMAVEGGKVGSVKLASIEPDPKDPEILRHEFQVEDPPGHWKTACQPNFQGETWGFPIALPQGHPGREGAITLTCASGAVGKCVRFGYKPWAKGPHGEDLTPYHAACVHLVRADYCGDGQPHTRNGTEIDLADDIGVQWAGTRDDPDYGFEAGWAPRGAVCVARTRWNELLSLEQLHASCPRLAQAAACDEAGARALGALVYNRSMLKPVIGGKPK